MGESQLVDVAIGLVFVWFLLSMLLSVVNEALALVFRIRAKLMWLAVGHLVNPIATKQGQKLLDTFLRLPFRPAKGGLDLRPVARPASSDAPATKVIEGGEQRRTKSAERDGAPMPAVVGDLQRIYDAAAPLLSDVAKVGRYTKLTKLPAQVFSSAITSVAAASVDGAPFTGADLVTFWKSNPQLAAAVQRAVDAPGVVDEVAAGEKVIGEWYDREMDRLSALYRRQNRKVLFVLAIPAVLFFQANAIATVVELNHDASLRTALVSAGTSAAGSGAVADVVSGICQPGAAPSSTTTTLDPYHAAAAKVSCAGDIVAAAQDFRLVPNVHGIRRSDLWHQAWSHVTRDWGLLGRLITLVALMFGAQFWFDVLRRLVGLRTSLSGTSASAGA